MSFFQNMADRREREIARNTVRDFLIAFGRRKQAHDDRRGIQAYGVTSDRCRQLLRQN